MAELPTVKTEPVLYPPTITQTSPTKIPYNNGFYAGAYNPDLPVIDPTKKD